MNPRSIPWLAPLFVVGCTLAAFLNSLDGEFLMDDHTEIVGNPLMDSLWPPWRVMFIGHQLPSRPLPYLTFAIDHAVWGRGPFGYHVTNLAIHVVAALSLFFVTRTTLSSPRLRNSCGSHADVLAAVIASLWSVHPLNTQAVTYIYQRLESASAMLCLLSLAAFAGAVARQWNFRWLAGSVLASAAAMLSKETAVVLPLLIASYDWLFCGDPPAPAGRRTRYYSALCSTWLVLGAQMVAQAGLYHHTGMYGASPVDYFLTQPRVILHYMRLAFWPFGLCFDPNWTLLTNWSDILPAFLFMTALGLAVVYGLARRRPWAWPGAMFLLALAPSSSFMPLGQIAAEYRMYLALAAVMAAVVLGIHAAIRKWVKAGACRTAFFRGAAGLALAAVGVLIVLTQERNALYATPGGIWLDVIEQGAGGTRALWNIAVACDEHHEFDAAIKYADDVMARNPSLVVYEHLVSRRLREGDTATAERYLRHAVVTQAERINRGDTLAVQNMAYLASVLRMRGQFAEAEALAAEHVDQVRNTLGVDHPLTGELLAIRADGLLRAGDIVAAEEAARAAYAVQLRAGKQADIGGGTAGRCLARILRQQGRAAEADEIERQSQRAKN
ncbi:MAG: tetratricopeptide repeat protein [Planctomycetia bacterium]|nr:tetratricopeptide repeat protein [Planctomycetia bacterium]